jgi:hypothetical protein
MTPGIYLSIDLDYWCDHDDDRHMRDVVGRARSLRVPTLVVSSHEMLISDIESRPCRRLVNIDYHDDLAVPAVRHDCGSWVGAIAWRQDGEYEWMHPHTKQYTYRGRCDHDPRLWWKRHCRRTGWNVVRKQKGLRGIDWRNVHAVGIATSWEYLGGYTILKHYQRIIEQLTGCRTLQQLQSWSGAKRLR